jgi:transcriptional regulator with XRE-family HTH domain
MLLLCFGGDMSTLGERIKWVREYYNRSQADFSEILSIDQSYLSYIENGKKKPSDKITRKLITDYNVNPEWLRVGAGDMILGEPAALPSIKKGKVMSDMDLLRTILVAIEDCIAERDDAFTPEKKADLVIACCKYFNNADESVGHREVRKQVLSVYDVLSKVFYDE